MNSVRQFAKLGDGAIQPVAGLAQRRSGGAGTLLVKRALCHSQRNREAYEPLLRAVVKIAFERTTLGISGLDKPQTRGLELVKLDERLRA
jgi:hypothetical protein